MISVAILGFGVVGSGSAELIESHKGKIKKYVGQEVRVKYILDLREFPNHPLGDRVVHDYNIILSDPEIKIVAEMMGGAHPAYDFSLAALKAKKNVVTSNKEVVATFGTELVKTARENGVAYMFEASVGGGIPLLTPLSNSLAANNITSIAGILNGTTNYILTRMLGGGKTFDAALSEAQEKGYAEKNPDADVLGIDACRKICILCALSCGVLPNPKEVYCDGITKISLTDVHDAEKYGASVKLIGKFSVADGGVYISVRPRFVPYSSPLARVDDVFNAALVNGDYVGDTMFFGRGAGKEATASAVVGDVLDIARHIDAPTPAYAFEDAKCGFIKDHKDEKQKFYLRFETDHFTDPSVSILEEYLPKIEWSSKVKSVHKTVSVVVSETTENELAPIIAKLETMGLALQSMIAVL